MVIWSYIIIRNIWIIMFENRVWQTIFSSSKWGIVIVCSTASGGLFSWETCTTFVLTDTAATGQNPAALNKDQSLWRAPSTSRFPHFPWLLCLPQSCKQPLAESMQIHLPCIGNSVLGGIQHKWWGISLGWRRGWVPSRSLHTRSWASSWQACSLKVACNEGPVTWY